MTSVTGNAAINQDWDFERARGRYWVNDPAFGAVVDDTTNNQASAFLAAITAAGSDGEVHIPAGSYLVNDCNIPTATGCRIVPHGKVIIKWDNDCSNSSFYYDGSSLMADPVTIDAVADETAYPAASDQTVTKLTGSAGDFDNYSVGDTCNILTNDTDDAGYLISEWFTVLEIAGDTSYILCNKKLYHTYVPGSNTTEVKRASSTPQIRIDKGITFEPSGDVTATLASRKAAIAFICPFDPVIDVDFNNAWNVGIIFYGCYKGTIKGSYKNLYVDYSENAYGYGIQVIGAIYRLVVDVIGDKTGHIYTENGEGTTYAQGNIGRHGSPMMCEITAKGENCRRALVDSHWGYLTYFKHTELSNPVMDDEENSNNVYPVSFGGIDQKAGTIVAHGNIRGGAYVADVGAASAIHIESMYMRSGNVSARPLINYAAQTSAVEIIVHNAYWKNTATGLFYPLDMNTANGNINFIYHNLTIDNAYRLIRYGDSGGSTVCDVVNCIYLAGANTNDTLLIYSQDVTAGNINLWTVNIKTNGSSNPAYGAEGTSGKTGTIKTGVIRSDATLTAVNPGDAATTTVSSLNSI